jgi:hypothetical protein
MISEWELWACANEMIRQHGNDAAIHAAMRLDALFEKGDQAGVVTWRLILARINELSAKSGCLN